MISPALMLSWMWGRKRKPLPEYQSPNTWSKWMGVNNEILALQQELVDTFTDKQFKIYHALREKQLEVDREKPWQGDYAKKLNTTYGLKEKE